MLHKCVLLKLAFENVLSSKNNEIKVRPPLQQTAGHAQYADSGAAQLMQPKQSLTVLTR